MSRMPVATDVAVINCLIFFIDIVIRQRFVSLVHITLEERGSYKPDCNYTQTLTIGIKIVTL